MGRCNFCAVTSHQPFPLCEKYADRRSMWNIPSGTCMPSAAEDGSGQQTHGVSAGGLLVDGLADGCPAQPPWLGPRTPYKDIEGEPFSEIPTYFKVAKCERDQSWRVLYSVYFKSDATHKSDWEGAMVVWKSADGGNWWTRESVHMDRHGGRHKLDWSDIPNTFNGLVLACLLGFLLGFLFCCLMPALTVNTQQLRLRPGWSP